MSDATIRIDRSQRQPLQELLLQRFTGITDPGLLIKRGDHGLAERLGNELAADVRLLNDLGWDPDDRREIFAVTVPVADFLATLRRLRTDAERGVDEPEDVRRGREEDDDALEQHLRARDACAELIARLDPRLGAA